MSPASAFPIAPSSSWWAEDGMKRLRPPRVVAEAPQWCTRSCAAKGEASHGAYWHRRTQGGKPDLHPDGERRNGRAGDPDGGGGGRRGGGREGPGRGADRGGRGGA